MMDHSFNSSYDSQGAVTAIAAVDANNDTHTVAAAYSPAGILAYFSAPGLGCLSWTATLQRGSCSEFQMPSWRLAIPGFIATAAFGSPLASQLDVFRDFRDRVLLRLAPGRAFVDWYYDGFGPTGATWLGRHPAARDATRFILSASLTPLKLLLYRSGMVVLVFSLGAAALLSLSFLPWPRIHSRRRQARLVSFALAFAALGVYYFVMAPTSALAGVTGYQEGNTYYYTLDHIDRPFNLRDQSAKLRWFEHHYPIGDRID